MDKCKGQISLEKGSSMIEVLVSVVVLSIGLLGVASLQTLGVRNSNSSYMRTQANVMAVDILDRMRANKVVAESGGYAVLVGSATIAGASIAANDVASWKTALANSIPGGDGAIDDCQPETCVVTIQWTDSLGKGVFATETISIESRL